MKASHNKFSIGSGATSQNWTGASATLNFPHRLTPPPPINREFPYGKFHMRQSNLEVAPLLPIENFPI